MADCVIFTENLKKTYLMGSLEVPAIRGVDVKVKKGEFVAIMGPSGSGKTTLLELVGLLLEPTSGRMAIGGSDTSGMSGNAKADFRLKTIGFVFQYFNLLMDLTARENVMLPGMMAKLPQEKCRARAMHLLGLVGLGDRIGHKPAKLSGGQQQRVAIARALMNSPPLLLADEPTGNLDYDTSLKVVELLRKLNRDNGQTILMVTHEPHLGRLADRIIYLKDGLVQRVSKR